MMQAVLNPTTTFRRVMVPKEAVTYNSDTNTFTCPAIKLTEQYFALDLPAAPPVMVHDEIVVEGNDVAEEVLEGVICRHLELLEPEQQKKGILKPVLNR